MAVADGTQGQYLPEVLVRPRKDVGEVEGGRAEVADAVGAGKGGDVEQEAATARGEGRHRG